MLSRFHFWLWGAIASQLITGLVHSISLFLPQQPANDTEKQLLTLMSTYHKEMGAGFRPSTSDLFLALSACFTAVCLLAGLINLYLRKQQLKAGVWKSLLLIQFLIFGPLFLLMLRYTFLPPVVLTGLIMVFLTGAIISSKNLTV